MARIGWVACSVCGNPESSVTENATGTLSVSCHKCQFSGYAKPGSKAARLIRAAMKPDEDATAPAPLATTSAADPPKPKPAAKPAARAAFSLGDV